MTRTALLLLAGAAALSGVAGYAIGLHQGKRGGEEPSAAGVRGATLATFEGGAITAEDFLANLHAQDPFGRRRFASPQGRKEFLDLLLREHLLSVAATEKGLDRDPLVVAGARRALVARLLDKEFSDAAIRAGVSDEELTAYFNAHISEYEREEQIRVALVFLAAPESDAAARKAKGDDAKRLQEEIRKKTASTPGAFAAIARVRSEDPQTRAADGDTRFLTRKAMAERWGPEVAEAAFALKSPGKLSDVIATSRGFVILQVLNFDAGMKQSLSDVKNGVRAAVAAEKRKRLLDDLVATLRRERKVTVSEQALATLKLEPPAETVGAEHK